MKRLQWNALGVVAALALVACDPGDVELGRDVVARTDARVTPGSDGEALDGAVTPGNDGGVTPMPDGGAPPTDGMVAMGAVRPEVCGNGVDDDLNGEVDDGCTCVVGTERPCYLGPEGTLNRGACRPGSQRCESAGVRAVWQACMGQTIPSFEVASNGIDDDCNGETDEGGARCVPAVQQEMGGTCGNRLDDDCDGLIDCMEPECASAPSCTRCPSTTESLCYGGVDDDCDGNIDCADTDCRGSASCMPSPCPTGQTPTYRERVLEPQAGPSSISAGDGQTNFPMTCEAGRCPAGQVAVAMQGRPPVCVPPPPMCPAGQGPAYRASRWTCEAGCELIIRYGYMFGFRRVCTRRPTITCSAGQSPTFVFETESWTCRPTCSNTTYDRINLDGMLVCIPC